MIAVEMEIEMEWRIHSFERFGPIRFGMSADEVEKLVGKPVDVRRGVRPGSHSEFRSAEAPIVRYRNAEVVEIEAFYDLPNVFYNSLKLFASDGLGVMRSLEEMNGGGVFEGLGVVVFEKIGLSTGRLDLPGREQHSITAFTRGLWDTKKARFAPVSFI
jgi:hypothetical protein